MGSGKWAVSVFFRAFDWKRLMRIGALLEEVPKEGEVLKFQGSAMVALASSKEELLEVLKNDIYAKNEVWDLSKVSDEDFTT
jgi:hypothetical protein